MDKGKYKTKCCYASCKTPFPETVEYYDSINKRYCCSSCAVMVNCGTVARYVRVDKKIKEIQNE